MEERVVLGPDDPALAALAAPLSRLGARLEILPWPEYRGRLDAALAAPRCPYAALCVPGHVWLPELAPGGGAPARLADLDGLEAGGGPALAAAAASYEAADLLPAADAEGRRGGRRFMLPLFSDGHLLFYRKDLVRLGAESGASAGPAGPAAAGPGAGAAAAAQPGEAAAATPIVSPLDLPRLAGGLAASLPPGMRPLALKAHQSEIFLDFLPYLRAAGGDIADADGRPAFAGAAGIRALELYVGLKALCPEGTGAYGNAEIAAALREGRVAMAVSWGGQAAAVMDPEGPFADRLAAAVLRPAWNATWGLSVPANLPRGEAEESLRLLYEAMGPAADREVARLAGSPVRASSYAPAELSRLPWLAAQRAMLESAGRLPEEAAKARWIGPLAGAVQAAFAGRASPREALEQAARG